MVHSDDHSHSRDLRERRAGYSDADPEPVRSPDAALSGVVVADEYSRNGILFSGAELVETIAADRYKGRVTVKLGPLKMVFLGNLHIENRDDTQRAATVKATWTETKGRGNAVTVTRFAMREHGSGTLVVIGSDVQLVGQVAQYGRGAGMISEVSAQLISTFAENLRANIHAVSPTPSEAHAENPVSMSQKEISVLELLWKVLVKRLRRIFT